MLLESLRSFPAFAAAVCLFALPVKWRTISARHRETPNLAISRERDQREQRVVGDDGDVRTSM